MNVLIYAPHRDDEIIGVGGTILKRKAAGDHVTVCLVTAREGLELPEGTKVIHEEMKRAHAFCHVDEYIGLPFWANNLENFPRQDLNKAFFDAIVQSKAEEVYLPFWGDMQKDHQIVTETAMVALREKYDHPVRRIYAYETLSETGINLPTENYAFIPNVFEDITDYLEDKKTALEFFKTQVHPFPDLRSLEAVEVLARFRGATVNVKAAEAFMLIRETK
jgi:N-acetylglucosamine malate deacetylase 1